MIYKISGEQPFQVLSDSFSVSPSESGYNLYLSADGVNYSQFATVAANTTRQFTGMNNGNYYILSGNTSEVQVNWNRDCSGGGGGGTAGVSSLDGQTGALTTKTVGGQSILGSGDIPVGGGDSNYVIVDALSAITNPVEGMIAFIPAHTYDETTNSFKCKRIPEFGFEGYVARIMYNGNEVTAAYQSNSNYYWSWTNDGIWYIFNCQVEGVNYPIKYKTHNDDSDYSNCYFLFEESLGGLAALGAEVVPDGPGDTPQATVTPYSETETKYVPDTFYQYDGTEWTVLDLGEKIILDEMTDAERATLYNNLKSLWDMGVRDFSNYKFYLNPDDSDVHNNWLMYIYDWSSDGDGRFAFGAAASRRDTDTSIRTIRCILKYTGELEKYTGEVSRFEMQKLSIIRERARLEYYGGVISGYTFDCANAPSDETPVVNWEEIGGGWILVIKKGGEGIKDGDGWSYINDNAYHLVIRDNHSYAYKVTGDTITVAFIANPPASISDLNISSSITYTQESALSVTAFGTDNAWSDREQQRHFYTGNTCSGPWQFEISGSKEYAEGGSSEKAPVYSFKVYDADKYIVYANPIVKIEELLTPIILNDSDGNPYNFEYRFHFNYGDYTVSLLANSNEYRYAQLTVTKKQEIQGISRADYEALVAAGTVDPNTLYVIN